MSIQSIHLVVPNPDDSAGMPLIDVYADDWDAIAQTVDNHLEPGIYGANVTISPIEDDWDELFATGTFTVFGDGTYKWYTLDQTA